MHLVLQSIAVSFHLFAHSSCRNVSNKLILYDFVVVVVLACTKHICTKRQSSVVFFLCVDDFTSCLSGPSLSLRQIKNYQTHTIKLERRNCGYLWIWNEDYVIIFVVIFVVVAVSCWFLSQKSQVFTFEAIYAPENSLQIRLWFFRSIFLENPFNLLSTEMFRSLFSDLAFLLDYLGK